MILFLDFDGVLHPEYRTSYQPVLTQLPALEQVLREFPRVEVVVSSAWRLNWRDQSTATLELRKHFAPDIAARVVGVTGNYVHLDRKAAPEGLYLYPRQWEIVTWLRAHRPPGTSWVAVDDRAYLFKPFVENLLETDPTTGLTADDLQELRRRLKQHQNS